MTNTTEPMNLDSHNKDSNIKEKSLLNQHLLKKLNRPKPKEPEFPLWGQLMRGQLKYKIYKAVPPNTNLCISENNTERYRDAETERLLSDDPDSYWELNLSEISKELNPIPEYKQHMQRSIM